MAAATKTPVRQAETLAELVHRLGDIPLERIRLQPPPGTATVKDVVRLMEAANKSLCELVDGVLVEKPMGAGESNLATVLAHFLYKYLDENDLGTLLGADGPFRLSQNWCAFRMFRSFRGTSCRAGS